MVDKQYGQSLVVGSPGGASCLLLSRLTPFTNKIQEATGTWDTVFIIAAALNILAAVLALFVLKPWRAKVVART